VGPPKTFRYVGDQCWVRIDLISCLLKERRIIKLICKIQERVLMAKSRGFTQVVFVFLGSGEIRGIGVGPFLLDT